MTIPASRRDELRRLVELVMAGDRPSHIDNPARAVLMVAVPGLLDEIDRLEADAKLPRECPICQCCETHDVPAKIADLTLRLQVATDANVADRMRIDELRVALGETLKRAESAYEDQRCSDQPLVDPDLERLRKVLG